MAFRISWSPEQGYVSIVAQTAQDALLLSADFERRGLPAMVSELDGTPLTSLDLELMIAAQSSALSKRTDA
ncbi:hypothetical protein [Methylopila sp. M107]|uniref:hypothetical protein n=1 Tax=Methylopila sp. M107 TaxID=1101190 RepID=UPI00036DA925|nr:hypothetical protein [Methylopila sp. M107]